MNYGQLNYACEVTEPQLKEIIKIADQLEIEVGSATRKHGTEHGHYSYAYITPTGDFVGTWIKTSDLKIITFNEFINKMKELNGTVNHKPEPKELKEYTPTQGEIVEVRDDEDEDWNVREFIAFSKGCYIVWGGCEEYPTIYYYTKCRPLQSRMTRAQAEKELGCKIID
jgi:hypothetical protein